jgi:dTMP kinase
MVVNSLGRFVTIEGIEGCGKSTHSALLKDWLVEKDLRVVLAREPGGTVISEKIREILLDPMNVSMDHRTELLLYLASRSQIIQELLLPALKEGCIVIVDRYSDSTLAYQGFGREIDVGEIRSMNSFASRDLVPDLTFLLDLDPVEGFRRKEEGSDREIRGDRLEMEDLEFHRKIREGFLSIAKSDPERIAVVRADVMVDEVQAEIRRIYSERFHTSDGNEGQ